MRMNIRNLTLLAILLFGMAAVPPVKAQVLTCVAPVKPACIMSDFAFSKDLTIERCQEDVQNYAVEAKDYSNCLREAADKMMATADDVLKQFRCKAGSADDC